MRVIVTLSKGEEKDTRIEGDAPLFDRHLKPWLGEIGMWLENWHFTGHSGPAQRGKVFIPWISALYIVAIRKD